jgi:hypothetical protein
MSVENASSIRYRPVMGSRKKTARTVPDDLPRTWANHGVIHAHNLAQEWIGPASGEAAASTIGDILRIHMIQSSLRLIQLKMQFQLI